MINGEWRVRVKVMSSFSYKIIVLKVVTFYVVLELFHKMSIANWHDICNTTLTEFKFSVQFFVFVGLR